MNFIASKYAIGDKVYFLENNQPKVGRIKAVNAYQDADSTNIGYFVDSSSKLLDEDELFSNGSLLLNETCKRMRLLEETMAEASQATESDDESVDSGQP